MNIKYDKLIKQNIAPKGAKMIGVYNSTGERMFGIPLGRLAPQKGTPIYSFGVISDTHIPSSDDKNYKNFTYKLDNALTFFEEQGASLVFHCGDVTNRGFVNSNGEVTTDQFDNYKEICDKHPNIYVYFIAGNHDSYDHEGRYTEEAKAALQSKLGDYNGNYGLRYTIKFTMSDDEFIFINQPSMTIPMNENAISYLEDISSYDKDKRRFIFVHPFLADDSGNPNNAYGSYLFNNVSGLKQRFINALTTHGNSFVFHGHSHFMPELQEVDKTTNYTKKNGFHSIHVPSLSAPAFINGAGVRDQDSTKSYGYLVDVYEDCIVLRARDFGRYENGEMVNPKWVAIGTYKI